MIRYVRQRDRYSCGPIAILNALKWLGLKRTLQKHLRTISRDGGCEYPLGLPSHDDFDNTLRLHCRDGAKIRKCLYPSIGSIEQCFHEKGAVILNYIWDPSGGLAHYGLFIGVSESGKTFIAVNIRSSGKGAVVRIGRRKLIYYLRRRTGFDGKPYPRAWFIKNNRH